MKRSGFKPKPRKPMKRTPLRAKVKPRPLAKRQKLTAKASKPKKTTPTITKLKKKLWAECKRITRKRYEKFTGGWDCYTCGKHLERPGQCQTGHFIPSSICSTEMRYDLGNLRVQCFRCNINLSGNWVAYEAHLKKEMGEDYPEKLKARNETTKGISYRADWYAQYLANYKEL